MRTLTVFGVLLSLLLLLGGLLYLVAQFLIRKMKSEHISFESRKGKLWIWRGFIIVLMLYSVFLLMSNRKFLFSFFAGPMEVLFIIVLIIYFVALIELVVIDLLLPDLIEMWKRILIEVFVFILLCGLTVFSFNVSLFFLAQVS